MALHDGKTVIDVEVISEEKTTPCPAHFESEEPCPIDAIFREVDDTLTDFQVGAELHARLSEAQESAEDLYHTGEKLYQGIQKTIPKVKAAFEKVSESDVFLGRREMMKRSF